jgi:hypothetical protein
METVADEETAVSSGVGGDSIGLSGGDKNTKNQSSQKAKGQAESVVAKQSSQKKSVVAKPEVESGFATTQNQAGKFATGDLESYGDEGKTPYAGVSKNEWRVIFRMLPPKKDGTQTISFYYKKRTSYVKKGKRVVPYRKGGKITTDGTKGQLQTNKERYSSDS